MDEVRYHADDDPALLNRILALAPEHSNALRAFLEGLPQRYLQTRLPEQIRNHFRMALDLEKEPVQLAFRAVRRLNEITLVTKDRPLLFADVAGVLSAWGMNIVKADAFSNAAGLIVDTFQFTDQFQTLELNPGEVDHFLEAIRNVVSQKTPLRNCCAGAVTPASAGVAKVEVQTRIEFDNESSSHSSLLQVVAQDTPGLLREVAKTFAGCDCNIEVALIDTEGEIAIDVFYLTSQGKKLTDTQEKQLQGALTEALEALRK